MDKIANRVRELLANHLGVEAADIQNEDFFDEDLHMTPGDMAEFLEKLSSQGFETAKINLEEIETVEDLSDSLALHQDIS